MLQDFSTKLVIPCSLAEMKAGKLKISKGVNIKEMTSGDDAPMFVAMRLVGDNDVGEGTVNGASITKKYLPQFVSQVAEAMGRSRKGNADTYKIYPGHQHPSDRGYEVRPVLGVLVGGGREGADAVAHCYIFPSAVNLREQCGKGIYPVISLEATADIRWNAQDKIAEVYNLKSFDGVAIANDSDVGISDSRIVGILKEMKIDESRKEEVLVKTVKLKDANGVIVEIPVEQLSNLEVSGGNVSEMTVDQLLKVRPDLATVIQEQMKKEQEVESKLSEMKTDISKKDELLSKTKAEVEEANKKASDMEAKVAEMKLQGELSSAKSEIEAGFKTKKYSDAVIASLMKDVSGNSVEEMKKSAERAEERLKELNIDATVTAEVSEMITGVVEGENFKLGESKLPRMSRKEAMLMIFDSGGKEFEQKYSAFSGNVYEMKNFYKKNGPDETKQLLNMTLAEMQTLSDFPDLLEYGLNPLLIDAYFSEVQMTQFQNFFNVFPLSRNDIPFPSMKGFQIGRIVDGEEYPLVSLQKGPKITVSAEDWGCLLNISHNLIRDSLIDIIKFNVMEVGRAHARKKDEVAAYLMGNSAGQTTGPVVNEVQAIRDARILGLEIYEEDTGIKRPRYYNSLIISPSRLEELVPATTTNFFQGVTVAPTTGDVRGIAGMKVYSWLWIPDDFCLLAVAKDKMIQAVREGLTIANANEFKTNSELVRSNEAFTFAVLDANNIMKVEFNA